MSIPDAHRFRTAFELPATDISAEAVDARVLKIVHGYFAEEDNPRWAVSVEPSVVDALGVPVCFRVEVEAWT